MGPFSVLLSLSVLSRVFGAVDKTSSSFSEHGKIGNFIIIMDHLKTTKGDYGNDVPGLLHLWQRENIAHYCGILNINLYL